MSEQQYYENPVLWDEHIYLNNKLQRHRLTESAAIIPEHAHTLLDVGTGNGAFLRLLEDQGTSLDMTGLERSAVARQMAVCAAEVLDGSIELLPFDDRSFDLVASLETIEHLPYGVYETGLRELQRVARDHILISVPYREKYQRIQCPYCHCAFHRNYHMRSFDDQHMSTLFESFEPIETRYIERRVHQWAPMFDYICPPASFAGAMICPQCSYSQKRFPFDNPMTLERYMRHALCKILHYVAFSRTVKRIWPEQVVPRWVIVLYRRRSERDPCACPGVNEQGKRI